jgi:hypothetical protein
MFALSNMAEHYMNTNSNIIQDLYITVVFLIHSGMETLKLTLSDPMSNLVRHYDFPVPDAFLDFNPFQFNFSATRTLPRSYLFWAGKRLVGYL